MSRSLAAPAAPAKFGALHHRDYRRYCLFALIGQIAENVEHVISYGFTIGVVGAFIGVELSLTLSATMVVLIALGLLVVEARRRPSGLST